MKYRRLSLIFAVICMIILVLLGLFTTLPYQSVQAAQSSQKDNQHLNLISEETGMDVSEKAISPGCILDTHYQVYLCPPVDPEYLPVPNLSARTQALKVLNSNGLLLIPESTNDRVMAFDPITGDLIDPNFIPADPTNLSTPIHAILSVDGNSILVSDQIDDVVQAYSLEGIYLGVFAPAGGADPTILDNIRGIALRSNGNLLVTVASGTNAHAVAEFDTAGNYLGNFIANSLGGLNNPFGVESRAADWLVGGITSDAIHRYDLTGAYLDNLTAIDTFPEQVTEIPNSNILVGNFSGTEEGVVEYQADGTFVGLYNPATLGDYRGVYELGNGNILTTNGDGVHEIDRSGNLVETKISGVSARFIEFIQTEPSNSISLEKTVGTSPSECATTDNIIVPSGTDVYYCYEITNTGEITLTLHDLYDDQLGTILSGLAYSLTPGASLDTVTAGLTISTTIMHNTVNTAVWIAYNLGPTEIVSSTASATVNVAPVIEISPEVLSSTQYIDKTTTWDLVISNTGETDLEWSVFEDASQVTMQNIHPDSITAICDTPSDISWVSVSPTNGTIPRDAADTVETLINSTDLSAGIYTGTLCFTSNDLINPLVTIPLTLTVEDYSYSVDLSDDQSFTAQPGETVTYTLSVTNTGNITDTFDLNTTGIWTATLSDDSLILGAGDSITFSIEVTIPVTSQNGDIEITTVMAISQGNNLASDSTNLTTVVLMPSSKYKIYLPILLKP